MSIDDDWSELKVVPTRATVEGVRNRDMDEAGAMLAGLPDKLYYVHASTSLLSSDHEGFYIREARPIRTALKGHMAGYIAYMGEYVWGPVEGKPADSPDGTKYIRAADCFPTLDMARGRIREVAEKLVEMAGWDIKSHEDNIRRYQESLEHCRATRATRQAFLDSLPKRSR